MELLRGDGREGEKEESRRNCRDDCLLVERTARQTLESGQIRSRRIDIYLEWLGGVVWETQQETCGERGDSEVGGEVG